jgi:hypothetical protein
MMSSSSWFSMGSQNRTKKPTSSTGVFLMGFPPKKIPGCVCSIVKEFYDGMWNGIRKANEHHCNLLRVAEAIEKMGTNTDDEWIRLYRNLLAAVHTDKSPMKEDVFALPLRELVIYPTQASVGSSTGD